MAELKAAVVPVTPIAQNCTLLWDADSLQAVVVDPGGDVERILAGLTQHGLRAEAIWLTHGHLDHAGGAEALRAALGGGIQVIGPHLADKFLLDSITAQAAQYGIAGLENAAPDRWLEEGEVLTLGPHRFEVLHCPGHSPGSVVFVAQAARFAQVGDVLFAGSVGRTDFSYGDHAALIGAIKHKLLPLGDDMWFVCGHGPGSTFGRERLNNPFLV
jgi:glyoxylase-like metal-dependent hydrolase (beta-lactamase superfamily II)